MDISADGRFLLYSTRNEQENVDLWALPLDKERKPFEVVRTDFNETMAQFSPDGKWIAYQSNKTGRDEIYLRAFPGPGTDIPVSSNGGGQVRWNPNGGKELFYVAADDQLMAVPIDVSPDGKTLEPGTPSPLFMTRHRQHGHAQIPSAIRRLQGWAVVRDAVRRSRAHGVSNHGDPELEARALRLTRRSPWSSAGSRFQPRRAGGPPFRSS